MPDIVNSKNLTIFAQTKGDKGQIDKGIFIIACKDTNNKKRSCYDCFHQALLSCEHN